MRRITLIVARIVVYTVAVALALVGLAIGALETGWAKNQLRQLIVRQANQYLTATLEIGRLEGSLLRGLQLGDIRLSRQGQTIVSVDDVELSYSIRELVESGVVIRAIRLVRPKVVAARQQDGRWNLAALLRREVQQRERSGPRRPIHILSIEIMDGDISFDDPLTFGAVRVPSRFSKLDVKASFDYEPVNIHVNLGHASWLGPDLEMQKLTGVIASGRDGWTFEDLSVRTPESEFTFAGRVDRRVEPTELDLSVAAARFAFQEWSRILPGLRNLAVKSRFDVRLKGPQSKLVTDLTLQSDAGGVDGTFDLDTTVPGWHAAGRATVERLNLALWLNRPNRPSDISGRIDFNLDLDLGRRFPRGSYTFEGSHAEFMGYEADAVSARGTISAKEVIVADAAGAAYGSPLRVTAGSVGIDTPFPFRFQGTTSDLDLRRVPTTVPVPHVESRLTLDYNVSGQFVSPYITGRATFGQSEFLGAAISQGATGSIDTSASPIRYAGEGDLSELNIRRIGEGLEVAWMQDPRYAGTIEGHFYVEGAGTSLAALTLNGGGRLARAEVFRGRLFDAQVTVDISNGSLAGTYDGSFSSLDPAVPFADPRFDASLTGSGRARFAVRDLLVRPPTLADYDVDGTFQLHDSVVRDLMMTSATGSARLVDGALEVANLEINGPALEGVGHGRFEFDSEGGSRFEYDVRRAELSLFKATLGEGVSGRILSKGIVTGPRSALHLSGDATVSDFQAGDVKVLTVAGHYEATVPADAPRRADATVMGRAEIVDIFGRQLPQADWHRHV